MYIFPFSDYRDTHPFKAHYVEGFAAVVAAEVRKFNTRLCGKPVHVATVQVVKW